MSAAFVNSSGNLSGPALEMFVRDFAAVDTAGTGSVPLAALPELLSAHLKREPTEADLKAISAAALTEPVSFTEWAKWVYNEEPPRDAYSSMMAGYESHVITVPSHAASGGFEELNPFDFLSGGRSTPMLWFYKETIDTTALISALEQTLIDYQVLSGRYKSPPTAVELSNAGVPVTVCLMHPRETTIEEAIKHVPTEASHEAPTFFDRTHHEAFVPVKQGMDPDPMSPTVPLLSLKITQFPAGGTAIGMLAQHRVVDGETQVTFMRNWARAFRGLDPDPKPTHDRCVVNRMSTGDQPAGHKPDGWTIKSIPPGEQSPPEFIGVMPKIAGSTTCVVPFGKSRLGEMKAAASVDLPAGAFVSTDDALCANVWRAMVAMRCQQTGLATDSEEVTTVMRACNVRKMCVLGPGFTGNAADQVSSALQVKEVLSMSTSAIALKLRSDLQTLTPEVVAQRAQWMLQQLEAGCTPRNKFDSHGLTFVVSSWSFDWESADFNGIPVCFDHGAIVPIVAVITPRPQGDGKNVYVSGPQESMEQIATLLTTEK